MNDIQWYYARDDERFGPVSTIELKRLADRHELLPSDLVWREGMGDWAEAGLVKGLFQTAPAVPTQPTPAEPSKAEPAPRAETVESAKEQTAPKPKSPARHPLAMLLAAGRSSTSEAFVASTIEWFTLLGSWAMVVAMALVLVLGVTLSVQTKTPAPILMAVAAIPILLVLQFAALRFCEALARLNRATRAVLASTVLPDLIGLLSPVLGLILLLTIAGLAIEAESYSALLPAVVVFIVLQHLATVSFLHVDENVVVAEDVTPGEEALGTLCYLLKAAARVVPVAFGAGACSATIMLVVALVQCLRGGEALLLSGKVYAFDNVPFLAGFALLPLICYLLFLLFALVIDIFDGLLMLRHSSEDMNLDE